MIPNKFVILWDNMPVGCSNSGDYSFKTNNPNSIKYWDNKKEADHYLDIMIMRGKISNTDMSSWKIVEIQFRIRNLFSPKRFT